MRGRVRAVPALAGPGRRRRSWRLLVGIGVSGAVADVPAVARAPASRSANPEPAVPPRSLPSTSSRCRGSGSCRGGCSRRWSASRSSSAHRALPVGRDPAAGAGFGDKVTPRSAHLSVLLGLIMLVKAWGYYLGPLRPPDVDARRGRGRVVHRRERAAARAQVPDDRRGDLRDPVPRQHPAAGVGLPVIAVGLLALVSVLAGNGVPLVRAAVPRGAAGVPARTAVHRATTSRRPDRRSRSTRSSHQPHAGRRTRSRRRTIQDNGATVSNIRLWRPRRSWRRTSSRCSGSVSTTTSTTSTSIATRSTAGAAC